MKAAVTVALGAMLYGAAALFATPASAELSADEIVALKEARAGDMKKLVIHKAPRPALTRLAGGNWSEPTGFTLPAAFTKKKKPGRMEYLRARITDGTVDVFASEGSGRVTGLSWADGLVELGHDAATIEPGMPVTYIPFASYGLET